MIVDHAGSLHKCVANCGADKLEAAFCEVLAHRIGLLRASRQLFVPPQAILPRLAADELPDVAIESTELFLHCEERLRVLHGGANLEPVPYDAIVGEQARNSGLVVAGHFARIESIERGPVCLSFLENGDPTQAGLRAFQNQELKQSAVIGQRNPPFGVVVSDGEFIARPSATSFSQASASRRNHHGIKKGQGATAPWRTYEA